MLSQPKLNCNVPLTFGLNKWYIAYCTLLRGPVIYRDWAFGYKFPFPTLWGGAVVPAFLLALWSLLTSSAVDLWSCKKRRQEQRNKSIRAHPPPCLMKPCFPLPPCSLSALGSHWDLVSKMKIKKKLPKKFCNVISWSCWVPSTGETDPHQDSSSGSLQTAPAKEVRRWQIKSKQNKLPRGLGVWMAWHGSRHYGYHHRRLTHLNLVCSTCVYNLASHHSTQRNEIMCPRHKASCK